MARLEGIRRDDWGSDSCCHCEEEEEWFLEVFHLDCFRLQQRRNARPAPAKEKEESIIMWSLVCEVSMTGKEWEGALLGKTHSVRRRLRTSEVLPGIGVVTKKN